MTTYHSYKERTLECTNFTITQARSLFVFVCVCVYCYFWCEAAELININIFAPAGCSQPTTLPGGCPTSTSTKCFMGHFNPETVLVITTGCVKHQILSAATWWVRSILAKHTICVSVVTFTHHTDQLLVLIGVTALHCHILQWWQRVFLFCLRLWAHCLQKWKQ